MLDLGHADVCGDPNVRAIAVDKPILDASAPVIAARNRLATLANDLPTYRSRVAAAEAELTRRQQRGGTPGHIRAAQHSLDQARKRLAGAEAAIVAIQGTLRDLEARHQEVWAEERARVAQAAVAANAEAVRKREARETERRKWIDVHARQADLKRRFGT